MELARHAESLGVDAIATIPPIYFPLARILQLLNTGMISVLQLQTQTTWIYNIPQLAECCFDAKSLH